MSETPIPIALKRAVMQRDGTRCLACGVQTTPAWSQPNGIHFDHIIPEAMGGPTVLDNLQVLCRTCNLSKGLRTIDYRGGQVVVPHVLTPVVVTGTQWQVLIRCDACDEVKHRAIAASNAEVGAFVHAFLGQPCDIRWNTALITAVGRLLAEIEADPEPLTDEDRAGLRRILDRIEEILSMNGATTDVRSR